MYSSKTSSRLSPLQAHRCSPIHHLFSRRPLLGCQTAEKLDSNYNPLPGEFMANLSGLASFVSELRSERTNLVDRLRHVDAALSVLGKLNRGISHTKPGHTVSASARKRMSLAQKARWAKANARKPKRTISAADKKRIAAAQRARWAKVKAQQK